MRYDEMKRLHRLTAILIKFQSSKSIKAKDLSEEYQVSTRTIYRDIRALERAGVPIGYEPGENYFLLEGYQLPPIHFTLEESQAIVTAKALVSQNSDASFVRHFNQAVEKVTAILRASSKKRALNLEAKIRPSTSRKTTTSDSLITIQKSITDFNVLALNYVSSKEVETKRKVNPLALYFTQDNWILVAYCRLRKDLREFRLDRIKDLKSTTEYFAPNQFSLDNYFKKYS